MGVSVTIFARNDETRIGGCVSAWLREACELDLSVIIVDFGSTDFTPALAKALAAADPRIEFRQAIIADKAGALDDCLHRMDNDAGIHIFTDASIMPADSAGAAISDALHGNKSAYGATALAATGRSRKEWAARTINECCLNPQLFALTQECIEEIRKRGIHLPSGWIGVGGLIAYLLLSDLEGGADDSFSERLIVADNAFFEFPSLPFSYTGARLWRADANRRAARRFQNECLYPRLKREGLAAMPLTAAALDRRRRTHRTPSARLFKSWRGERRFSPAFSEQHRGGLLKEFLKS